MPYFLDDTKQMVVVKKTVSLFDEQGVDGTTRGIYNPRTKLYEKNPSQTA